MGDHHRAPRLRPPNSRSLAGLSCEGVFILISSRLFDQQGVEQAAQQFVRTDRTGWNLEGRHMPFRIGYLRQLVSETPLLNTPTRSPRFTMAFTIDAMRNLSVSAPAQRSRKEIPPPIHRGMTKLDRDAFKAKLKCLAVRVDEKSVGALSKNKVVQRYVVSCIGACSVFDPSIAQPSTQLIEASSNRSRSQHFHQQASPP
jgi:hypothetical protein